MRNLRRELLNLAAVLSVPVAAVLSIPVGAFSFRASEGIRDCPASAAFVTLTDEQESEALVAARTAWQTDAASRRGSHVRLPLGDLPDVEESPIVSTHALPSPEPPEPLAYRPSAWKPTLGAPAPVRLEPETPVVQQPTFAREELLKLN